jgi:hypothetical protein
VINATRASKAGAATFAGSGTFQGNEPGDRSIIELNRKILSPDTRIVDLSLLIRGPGASGEGLISALCRSPKPSHLQYSTRKHIFRREPLRLLPDSFRHE